MKRSLLLILCCFVLTIHTFGCGNTIVPQTCTNDINPLTVSANARACQSDCDCNNQVSVGTCVLKSQLPPSHKNCNGVSCCVSKAREACEVATTKQQCLLEERQGCKVGVRICKDDGLSDLKWGNCKPITPKPEQGATLCTDGIDNDCDGKTDINDEECICIPNKDKEPCYTKSKDTENVGACKAGTRTCTAEGTWGPCENEVTPKEEKCNGQDDDCDGQTDEELQKLAPLCEKQQGVCAGKRKICGGSRGWLPCAADTFGPNYEPNETECDGKDNNCNGQVDEKLEKKCFTAPSGCREDGNDYICELPCAPGTQTCTNGTWGTCIGQKHPGVEDCDGKDNDCDGQVDEEIERLCYPENTPGCTRQSDGTYNCKGACSSGKQQCSRGRWQQCNGDLTPKRETCNKKDDDCDGQTDEDLQRRCYTGSQGCRGPEGGPYSCTSPCQAGTQTCKEGVWQTCAGEVTNKPETCDGKDNDCDGKIDNGFANLGTTCSVGQGICKATGSYICTTDEKSTKCNVTPKPKQQELCNNKDDNCDGTIDEGCPCQSSCRTNNDCLSKACGNRKTCNLGKCIDPSVCPKACVQNAECQVPGCQSKTLCVAGQCVDPNICPANCAQKEQCGVPKCKTNGTTLCVQKQCVSANYCPATCQTDTTCAFPGCGSKTTCCKTCPSPKPICISKSYCPTSCTQTKDCYYPGCGAKIEVDCLNKTCINLNTYCPSSCKKDADCTNFRGCGNNPGCYNGKCIDFTTASCPTKCTTDWECQRFQKCSISNNAGCYQGTCVDWETFCPTSCQSGDCSKGLGCFQGNSVCYGGKCQNFKTFCPSSCTQNNDCWFGGCSSNGNGICYKGKCEDGDTFCPSSCTQDSDCQVGGCQGKTTCAQGKCIAKNSQCNFTVQFLEVVCTNCFNNPWDGNSYSPDPMVQVCSKGKCVQSGFVTNQCGSTLSGTTNHAQYMQNKTFGTLLLGDIANTVTIKVIDVDNTTNNTGETMAELNTKYSSNGLLQISPSSQVCHFGNCCTGKIDLKLKVVCN